MRGCFPVTVEPIAFLSLFGAALLTPVSQQYIYHKLLSQDDNRLSNATIITNSNQSCINITTSAQARENIAQKDASLWLLYLNIAAIIPAMFTSLLLGAWSDRAGRKMVLIIPSVGRIVQCIVYILVVYLNLPIPYLLIGNIICGLSGYTTTTVAACMAYIADITSKRHRTLRIVTVDTLIGVGSGLAGFISGYWIRAEGFENPFWLILACHIASIVYTIIFVRETIIQDTRVKVLTLQHFVDMWKVFSSPSNHRWMLIIYVACFGMIEMALTGTDDLMLLYSLKWPFCFGPILAGYLNGAISCGFITSLLSVKLLQLIPNFSNHWMIEIGLCSAIAGLVLATFANTVVMLFLVPVLEALAIMPLSVLRACMSRVVLQDQQGSMFAAVGCIESISLFLAYAIFNNIYSATMYGSLPGLTFLVGAVVLVLPVFLIWYVECCHERYTYSIFVESVGTHSDGDSASVSSSSPILKNALDSSSYNSCN